MNNAMRRDLKRAKSLLVESSSIIENVSAIEGDHLDNTPENLQFCSRYEEMEDNIDNMEDALSKIEEAIDIISGIA